MTLTGTRIDTLIPGSAEWLSTMSASKVAAVLDLSPYKSRFTLWHEMAGTIPREQQTGSMARGHYLESGVVAWWQDQHPEYVITGGPSDPHMHGDSWRHPELTWATASPDRILMQLGDEVAPLEVKTAADFDGWGPKGTDEIPPGYRAQCVWQMFVLGAPRCHVAVLLPFLEFREYVIEADADEQAYIVSKAIDFMASLEAGQAPPLDGADSTYLTIKQLHPDINGDEIELDVALVREWLARKEYAAKATELEQQAKSDLVNTVGNARKATCNGWTIGTRASKQGGTPYFTVSKSLPTADELATRKEIA